LDIVFQVCPDLAGAFVAEFVQLRPRSIALAGGNTPRRPYARIDGDVRVLLDKAAALQLAG
jgi:hypothetical protein